MIPWEKNFTRGREKSAVIYICYALLCLCVFWLFVFWCFFAFCLLLFVLLHHCWGKTCETRVVSQIFGRKRHWFDMVGRGQPDLDGINIDFDGVSLKWDAWCRYIALCKISAITFDDKKIKQRDSARKFRNFPIFIVEKIIFRETNFAEFPPRQYLLLVAIILSS